MAGKALILAGFGARPKAKLRTYDYYLAPTQAPARYSLNTRERESKQPNRVEHESHLNALLINVVLRYDWTFALLALFGCRGFHASI
jgi:hypothetical protein